MRSRKNGLWYQKLPLFSDLPDEGPVISGTLPLYNPGDTLSANCSSFNSFPSATLNWYINGQVAPKRLLVEYPVTSSRLQLYTSTLGLRLKVEKNLFTKSGDIKIKCTATIDPIYWKSNEESIQGFQERSYINFWNTGKSLLISCLCNYLLLLRSCFSCGALLQLLCSDLLVSLSIVVLSPPLLLLSS
jgi:hypothetical protein